MMYLIILSAMVISAINWFKWKIVSLAITYFLIDKGYNTPNEYEMKEYTNKVVRRLFKMEI